MLNSKMVKSIETGYDVKAFYFNGRGERYGKDEKHLKACFRMESKDADNPLSVAVKHNYGRNYAGIAKDNNLSADMFDAEYNLFFQLADKSHDELNKLTVESLQTICIELMIPKTGRKSAIVHRIMEKVEDIKSSMKKRDEATNIPASDPDRIVKFIANNRIHEIIAKAIIKKIACSPTDEQGRIRFDGCIACQKIYFNGFDNASDPVIDDIIQDMFVALFDDAYAGILSVENGFIVFSNYINEKGENKSHWLDCYKSIRKTLSTYRQTNSKLATTGNYVISYDNNDNERVITDRSNQYRFILSDMVSIDSILTNKSLIDFSVYVRKQAGKHADIIIEILGGLCEGYTQKEIAEHLNISVYKVNRNVALMRTMYDVFMSDNSQETVIHETGRTNAVVNRLRYGCSDNRHCYGDVLSDGHFSAPYIPAALKHDEYREKRRQDVTSVFSPGDIIPSGYAPIHQAYSIYLKK